MAVHQATGMSAVSLPNGASSLPLDILSCFERFSKIYLWLDNDEAGRSNRRKLAEKLGLKRTYLVQTDGEKDANDILRQDASRIQKYINEAKTIPDQNILVFSDLKQSVLNRLSKSEENQGVKSRRFDFFNHTIKGLRKGELTVLTGPTGSGKTSFLSQLSLDFCEQDTPTLWGSFEIKNEILATNMLMQMSGEDLVRSQEKFPYWSDRFNQLPLYFMNFFGSTGMEQIISTIDYAIYKFDIQHIVIDNLQFLMGTQARGISKFDMLDKAIEQFRELATKRDIHLTVVIHPKKVDESEDLHISSVFGSAKATQEADNVVIIQSRDNYRVIDIKKNRYNGDVGKKGLIFDKANKNFYELSTLEVSDLINKRAPSDLILKKRESLKEKIANELSAQNESSAVLVSKPKNKKPSGGNNNDGGNSSSSSSNNNNNNNGGTGGANGSPTATPKTGESKGNKVCGSSKSMKGNRIEKKMQDEVEQALSTNYVVDEAGTSEEDVSAEVIEQETGTAVKGEQETCDEDTKKSAKREEWDNDSLEPTDSIEAVYARHRVIPPKDHSMKLEELEKKNSNLHPWEYAKQQQGPKTPSPIDLEEMASQIFEYQVNDRADQGNVLDRQKNQRKENNPEDGVFDAILKHKQSENGLSNFHNKKRKL